MAREIAFTITGETASVQKGAQETGEAFRKMGEAAAGGAATATKGFDLEAASLLQLNRRVKDLAVEITDLKTKMEATQKSGGVVSEADIKKLNTLGVELQKTKQRQDEVKQAHESTGSAARNLANDYGSVDSAMLKMETTGKGLSKTIGTIGTAALSAATSGAAWGAAIAVITAEMARQIDKASTHEAKLAANAVQHQKAEAALKAAERGAIAYSSSMEKMIADMERLIPNSARLRAELEKLGEVKPPEVFAKYEADTATWAQALKEQLEKGKTAWLEYAAANEPALRAVEKAATLHKDALDPAIRAALQAIDAEAQAVKRQTAAMEELNKKYEKQIELRKMQGAAQIGNADGGPLVKEQDIEAGKRWQAAAQAAADAEKALSAQRQKAVDEYKALQEAAKGFTGALFDQSVASGDALAGLQSYAAQMAALDGALTNALATGNIRHLRDEFNGLTADQVAWLDELTALSERAGGVVHARLGHLQALYEQGTITFKQLQQQTIEFLYATTSLNAQGGSEIQKFIGLFARFPEAGEHVDALGRHIDDLGEKAERAGGRMAEFGKTTVSTMEMIRGAVSQTAEEVAAGLDAIGGGTAALGGSRTGSTGGPSRSTLGDLTYMLGRAA